MIEPLNMKIEGREAVVVVVVTWVGWGCQIEKNERALPSFEPASNDRPSK